MSDLHCTHLKSVKTSGRIGFLIVVVKERNRLGGPGVSGKTTDKFKDSFDQRTGPHF